MNIKNKIGHSIKLGLVTLFGIFSFPYLALGQENSLSTLLSSLQGIINQLIPLVASLALLAFFWGLAKYIFQAADEDAQESGKRIMIAGIIALFLIASVGGIVQFLASAFGLSTGSDISPPTINQESLEVFAPTEIVYNEGDGIG